MNTYLKNGKNSTLVGKHYMYSYKNKTQRQQPLINKKEFTDKLQELQTFKNELNNVNNKKKNENVEMSLYNIKNKLSHQSLLNDKLLNMRNSISYNKKSLRSSVFNTENNKMDLTERQQNVDLFLKNYRLFHNYKFKKRYYISNLNNIEGNFDMNKQITLNNNNTSKRNNNFSINNNSQIRTKEQEDIKSYKDFSLKTHQRIRTQPLTMNHTIFKDF